MVGNSPAHKFLSPPFRTPPRHAKNNRPCQGFGSRLASKQPREKLQCLHENLMWNDFRKTAVLKKRNNIYIYINNCNYSDDN